MKKLTFITFLSIFLCACSADNSGTASNTFIITNCEKINNDFSGFAKLKITVKNNTNHYTGQCWINVNIMKGTTIIETKSAVSTQLKPGISQILECWFNNFDQHGEYDEAEVILNWSIDSIGYSKTYSY